jgi:hypothetical protein
MASGRKRDSQSVNTGRKIKIELASSNKTKNISNDDFFF